MNFLNSPEWRKFQESVGHKTFNLNEGYLIKLSLPLGKSYLYSPYEKAPEFLDEIKKIGQDEGAIFFKYEPLTETSIENKAYSIADLKKLGFTKASKALQPQRTIVLDLKKSEEELLANMHEKTRYNTRLAQKRGIRVEESRNKQEDFRFFWDLLKETAERDKFNTHPKSYYQKLLLLDMAKLYIASKNDKSAAGAIIIFYGNTATYLHGASSYESRSDMAPYFLHWKILQDAKAAGSKNYDFWGIDETRWPGVTRFKRGFGGREVGYAGSFDLPLNKLWYRLYKLKNKIR